MIGVRHLYPEASVELWCMDEHRVGLKPILRRVWARRGQRPLAPVRPRYEWLYLYAFCHPRTGRVWWLSLPTVSIEAFNLALAEFARALGLGRDQRVILTLDQAGWHTSDQVVAPEGLNLLFLPPYSPELQPAERLWPLTNEPLANCTFRDLDELEAVQLARCLQLSAEPERVRGHTLYHWWPDRESD